MSRSLPLLLALACGLGSAAAQDAHQAERARLERALARVETALAALDRTQTYTRVHYDVRMLVEAAPDFPGERLIPPSDLGGEYDNGFVFSSFGDCREDRGPALEPDMLEELVTSAVGDDHWDEPASIEIARGWLIVSQRPQHHARIRATLAALGRELEQVVQVECGLYRLPTALAVRLRAGAGSLDPSQSAALDAAVGAGEASLLEASVLLGRDGQLTSLWRLRQQAFLQDVERSSGGTGTVVEQTADPIVSALETGLSLEARALCTPERVQVQVRWIRATLDGIDRQVTDFGQTQLEAPRVTREVVEGQAELAPGQAAVLRVDAVDGGERWWVVRARRLD